MPNEKQQINIEDDAENQAMPMKKESSINKLQRGKSIESAPAAEDALSEVQKLLLDPNESKINEPVLRQN